MYNMLVSLFLIFFSFEAYALQTEWDSADYLQARMISADQAYGEQEKLDLALEIRLGSGWHAYWRMPGDGGLPPQLDWSQSENVKSIEVNWPTPERIETLGLYSFGYTGAVLMPVHVIPEERGRDVKINLDAKIMVCKDICVPQDVSMDFVLPAADNTEASPYAHIIEKAWGDLPNKGDLPGLKIENVVIGPDAVVVNAYSEKGFEDTDLFVEAGDMYVTAVPEITVDEKDTRKAMIRVKSPEGLGDYSEYVMGKTVTLTLKSARNAIEKTYEF